MIIKITDETPIENLNLKNRTYNCLKRSNINTVGEVMKLTETDFASIKYFGEGCAKEVLSIQEKIASGELDSLCVSDNPESIKDPTFLVLNEINERTYSEEYAEFLFLDNNKNPQKDVPVSQLNITPAKKGALMKHGYNTLSKIVLGAASEVRSIKSLGKAYDIIKQEIDDRLILCFPVNQSFETAESVAKSITEEYRQNEELASLLDNAIRIRTYDYENGIDPEEVSENRNLLTFLYRDELIRQYVEDYILFLLKDSTLEYFELRKIVPHSLVISGRFDDILFEMESKNLIEKTEDGYTKFLPYLIDWIQTGLKTEREKDIVRRRISEITLEKIGTDYNLTRERIRQIEAKVKRKYVCFKEKRYIYWYQKYDFTKEQFCEIFNILPASYDSIVYLTKDENKKNGTKKEQKPKLEIVKALDDEKITPSIKRRFPRVLSEQYILLDGEYVFIEKNNILESLLKQRHSEESVRIDDLMEEYNEIIRLNNLSLDILDETSRHATENYVIRLENIIKREKCNYRYYDYSVYDFDDFFKQIDFSQLWNTEISVQKIMNMYPDLMEKYDIHNDYELHYVFQRHPDIIAKYGVTKEDAPNIIIGTANRETQTKLLIFKLAPISIKDFCKAYEEEYGVDAATVQGTYYNYYREYVTEGSIIDTTQEPLRDDELFKMKMALPEDFYFLEDIEKKYYELFPNGNPEKVNHYNIRKMGFNIYCTHALRNTYNTVKEYFVKFIQENRGIYPDAFDQRINTVQDYYIAKEALRNDFELFEILPGKLITFERLQEKYPTVTKEILIDYAKKAVDYSEKDIFTIHSIRKAGFKHELDTIINLESEFFFSGLIRNKKDVNYSKSAGDYFFSKTNPNIDRATFLKKVIEEIDLDIIPRELLSNYMEDEYDILFDQYDLPRIIRKIGYYYSEESRTIYLKAEDYRNELL